WFNGSTDPAKVSGTTALKAERVLGVPWEWLVTGRDPDVLTDKDFVTVAHRVGEEPSGPYALGPGPSTEVTVPFYPRIKAAAGAGYSNHEEDQREPLGLKFRGESLRRQGIDPAQCYVITARGDSMEPLIYSGDSILFDSSRTTIKDGCLYVVDIDHHTVVKRLFHRPGNKVLVHSENPQHPAFETTPNGDGFKVLGEVRWRAGWV
ncbi:MAG: helix-turn-helix transcriptional regulator, partial [Planctomycetes bacterium]|nr:helix-turn-helix transcriptional regulator [Planctomycetota bacterium]